MASAVIAIHQKRRSSALAAQLQKLDDDVLCPPEERRRSGRMEKKMTASKAQARPGTDGTTWLPRFAVLNDEKLAFVKAEGDDSIIDFIPLSEVEAVSLQHVDKDEDNAGVSSLPRPASFKSSQGSLKVLPKEQSKTSQEYHLIIQTVADGFNSGRRYVHRVPPEDAEVSLGRTRSLARDAGAETFVLFAALPQNLSATAFAGPAYRMP